jgi:hypothetical protein
MKIYENQRIADWAVAEVQRKMYERSDRTGLLHASELYQGWRKTVLMRTKPLPHNREAILKFAVGFAMQEWFLGVEDASEECLGVLFSPDRVVKGQVLEFKTTRKSYEKYAKIDDGTGKLKLDKTLPKVKFDPQENASWILRTRAYAATHDVKRAHIIVYFIYGNVMSAWTIEFTAAELEEAKRDIAERREALETYLLSGELPPVTTCETSWECTFCPYLIEFCAADLKAAGLNQEVQD